MKRIVLTLSAFVFALVTFANTLTGPNKIAVELDVVSSQSHKPVSDVSISFLNGSKENISPDEKGHFTLVFDETQKESTVLIKSYGYKDKIVNLKDLKAGKKIEVELQPTMIVLDEVVIEG